MRYLVKASHLLMVKLPQDMLLLTMLSTNVLPLKMAMIVSLLMLLNHVLLTHLIMLITTTILFAKPMLLNGLLLILQLCLMKMIYLLDMIETDDDKNDIRHDNKYSAYGHDDTCDEPHDNCDDAAVTEHSTQDDWCQNDDQGTLCPLEPNMPTDNKHTSKFSTS